MEAEKSCKIVPWRTPEQFLKVYQRVYSPSISDKRWAVDQISVWNTRCHPALPTAIEATECLTRAVIHDMLYVSEKTFCLERDVQSLYSFAVIRFVNLMIEIDQRGQSKVSMTVLARKLQIPQWIVGMRHEATHADLPSLPVLRMAAEESLKYLEETFWKVEATSIKSVVNQRPVYEQEIKNLLTQYRNIQMRRWENKEEKAALAPDLKKVIWTLEPHTKNKNRDVFLEVLVQPEMFLCPKDHLRLLHISSEIFLENDDDVSLPNIILMFWMPLMRLLHSKNLIPAFVEKLLLSLDKCGNVLCHKVAVAWAYAIILATSPNSAPDNALAECFKRKGIMLNLQRLLYACMKGANKYTHHLFQLIVRKLGGNKQYDKLFCIMAVYQGMLISKTDEPVKSMKRDLKSELVFTVEDAEEDIMEAQAKKLKINNDANIWSRAPVSTDFAQLPLGAIINPVNPEGRSHSFAEDSLIDAEFSRKRKRFVVSDERDKEETVVLEDDIVADRNGLEIPETFEIDMVYRKRD